MGRQANDSAALHSSIALLQERFRQLQRVKEMREEKELLRLVAQTESRMAAPSHCNASPAAFNHPHAALLHYRTATSPSPDQYCSQTKYLNFLHPAEVKGVSREHRAGAGLGLLHFSTKGQDDSTEVDTSLHL